MVLCNSSPAPSIKSCSVTSLNSTSSTTMDEVNVILRTLGIEEISDEDEKCMGRITEEEEREVTLQSTQQLSSTSVIEEERKTQTKQNAVHVNYQSNVERSSSPCDDCLQEYEGERINIPRRYKDIIFVENLAEFITMPDPTIIFLNCNFTNFVNFGSGDISKFILMLSASLAEMNIVVELSSDCCRNNVAVNALKNLQKTSSCRYRFIFYTNVATNEINFLPLANISNACEIAEDRSQLMELVLPTNLTFQIDIEGKLNFKFKCWIQLQKRIETFSFCCESSSTKFDVERKNMRTSSININNLHACCREILTRRSKYKMLLENEFVKNSSNLKQTILNQLDNAKRQETASGVSLVEQSHSTLTSAINSFVSTYDARLLALEHHLVVTKLKLFCQQAIQWSANQMLTVNLSFRFIVTTKPGFRRQERNFNKFYFQTMLDFTKCDSVLCDAEKLNSIGLFTTVQSLVSFAKTCIGRMLKEMESKKEEIITVSKLYQFVDEAYSWALNGMKFVASLSMKDCVTSEACQKHIDKFDEYMQLHPPIQTQEFIAMQDVARRFGNLACEKQCEISLRKCQETEKLFQLRRELLEKARNHLQSNLKKKMSFRQSLRNSTMGSMPNMTENINEKLCTSQSNQVINKSEEKSTIQNNIEMKTIEKSCENNKDTFDNSSIVSSQTDYNLKSRQRPRKMLRKSASMCGPRSTLSIGSPLVNTHLQMSGKSKSSLAIEELIFTEREYVQSLLYIVENYMPEMNRLDVPQPLRGKRGVIFGNIENITDFHNGKFLTELSACVDKPLEVAQAFLRHKDSFGLYALYSKNKPQSDAVMSDQGTNFFKVKQRELADKMDLASYLLKPVQRMGKYALLLHNIGKHTRDPNHKAALSEAEAMVKYQLRHGNDLLAMDSIIECEINLKEQGELIRQEQFVLISGRKKLLRHVFLFTDVIVLCKPMHTHGGHDTYLYKHSYKTSEIGLTENIGDAGVKFEIWLRKCKNGGQSFVLHSSSRSIKDTWVGEIRQLLWKQALRNKENRRSEMLNMGVGSKPFLDLQASANPITERSVSLLNSHVLSARTRSSIAVGCSDTMHKRPHSLVSTSSNSSTGSLVPSLNLASQQPNSYLDFQAILEDAESESDSARSSSMCTSHTSHDDNTPLDGDIMLPAKPAQTFGPTCLVK